MPTLGDIAATRAGRYLIVEADLPDGPAPIGVLLQDPETDRLYPRFRRDLADADEVLGEVPADMEAKAEEMGAEALLSWLEENASNTVRVTDRRDTIVHDFERTLERLYQANVRTPAERSTHVPLLTLRSAAGPFLQNAEIETKDWIEVPASVRINDRLFAAAIEGTSMEPTIPDGSVCLFRKFDAGSRAGMLVLVEEEGSRYTVKRYTSRKVATGDEGWKHESIVLEPLNPEHEDIILTEDEDRYRVIAEFIRVLF